MGPMEQKWRWAVEIVVNRGRIIGIAGAIACALVSTSAFAKDPPASLSIAPIRGSSLLSPVEETRPAPSLRLSIIDAERAGLLEEPAWRLERDGDPVTGKRARLSVPVGSTTVFALGGKLARRTGSTLPDPAEGPTPLAGRKMDSGRVYGAGVERRVGPFDVSAAYQYSRVSAGEAGDAVGSGHARSHSLRATARIRFRN
jgi:hypothetical protein